MTTYFWVGGSGNFTSANTTNISLSSGGVGGAGPVTASDNLIFDSLSSPVAYGVSMTGGTRSVLTMTMGAPLTGALTWSGSGTLVIAGSLNLSGGANITRTFTGNITFSSTTTGNTLLTNTVGLASPLAFDGVGGVWALSDDLTNTSNITLTNGSFSFNGHNATVLSFLSTNSNIRSIIFTGSEVLTLTLGGTAWNTSTATNLTFTPASGTIKYTDATSSAKVFSSGGLIFNKLWFSGAGTGTNRISGNNTFTTILMDSTLAAKTLLLASGSVITVTTVSGFQIEGDATHQTTLQASTSGSSSTLSISSGTVNLHYTTIKDTTATGGATFNALKSNGNVDGGNNSGWNFGSGSTLSMMACG